ncbi:MAG: hypothetical protein LWX83_06700 [Anaerolineae bacterium]|nr:hypothetical protein [Anaerolineae bacterium]
METGFGELSHRLWQTQALGFGKLGRRLRQARPAGEWQDKTLLPTSRTLSLSKGAAATVGTGFGELSHRASAGSATGFGKLRHQASAGSTGGLSGKMN